MLDSTLSIHKESMSHIIDNTIDTNYRLESNLENELSALNKSIVDGKNRLTSEINCHVQSLYEKQIYMDKKTAFHKDIETIENVVASLVNVSKNLGLDMDMIQDNIDNITFSLVNIKTKLEERVNKEINEIDTSIKRSEYIIKSLGDSFSIFKSTSYTHVCSICLTNNVEVYVDCGHTYCSTCVKNNFCYLCRKKVNKVSKLYFSL